eukprot:549297-Prymnesium_polylepis.1
MCIRDRPGHGRTADRHPAVRRPLEQREAHPSAARRRAGGRGARHRRRRHRRLRAGDRGRGRACATPRAAAAQDAQRRRAPRGVCGGRPLLLCVQLRDTGQHPGRVVVLGHAVRGAAGAGPPRVCEGGRQLLVRRLRRPRRRQGEAHKHRGGRPRLAAADGAAARAGRHGRRLPHVRLCTRV